MLDVIVFRNPARPVFRQQMNSLDLLACPGRVNLLSVVSLVPGVGAIIHFHSVQKSLNMRAAAVFLIVRLQSFFQQLLEQIDPLAAIGVSNHIFDVRMRWIELDLLELEDVEMLVQDGIAKG